MANTVTFRLDPETARILRELERRGAASRSRVIRDALRACWESGARPAPSAWEVYSKLGMRPGRPTRDRARHVRRLLKEKLIAKRGKRTL